MSIKIRLVDQAIDDIKAYINTSPSSKSIDQVRKAAAEALEFLISPRCKQICKEASIDYATTVVGFISKNARRPQVLQQALGSTS